MNITQYTSRLNGLASQAATQIRERSYFVAANEMLANIKNRIQRKGLDSAGNKMAGYSTKPSYYSKNQFVKKGAFKGVGKGGFRGEKIIKSRSFRIDQKTNRVIRGRLQYHTINAGQPKSMYMEHGYKQLRDTQGMPTDVRTLNYSGDTMLAYVIGKDNTAILLGFDKTKQSKIRKALEKRNGRPIFSATQGELKRLSEAIVATEINIIKDIFNG